MKPEPKGVHQVAPMPLQEAERLAALWCAGQPLDDLPQWRTAMQVIVRELANVRAEMAAAQPATPALQAGSPEPMRKALAWFVMLQEQPGEDSNDRFERVAETFRRDTGYLRPGKDCRVNDHGVRQDAWDKWIADGIADARAALAAPAVGALGDALSVGVPPPPMSDAAVRVIFLSHGFTIKPGNFDLKGYVYAAAEALCTARDAQWLARAGGVRAAATLGGTGGSGEEG